MQYESPNASSDTEFTYLAIGMVVGAVPGIIIGLLVAMPLGNPAMWVSVAAGVGIVIGMGAGKAAYRKKLGRTRRGSDACQMDGGTGR